MPCVYTCGAGDIMTRISELLDQSDVVLFQEIGAWDKPLHKDPGCRHMRAHAHAFTRMHMHRHS